MSLAERGKGTNIRAMAWPGQKMVLPGLRMFSMDSPSPAAAPDGHHSRVNLRHLKRLSLYEAQRLMLADGADASGLAADCVRPSRFNRE